MGRSHSDTRLAKSRHTGETSVLSAVPRHPPLDRESNRFLATAPNIS